MSETTLDVFKRVVVGRPRASTELNETLLTKTLALPIFASDPLSSVAYATEAALVVLITASATAGHLVLPISIAIAAVLAIVVLSYTQTVQAYETSGGAYVVAKENLGTLPSLVAAAALLVDYVLTVSVSVAAGVAAMYVMIAAGVAKCADGTCPQAHVPHPIAAGTATSVGIFVVLRAFASGS